MIRKIVSLLGVAFLVQGETSHAISEQKVVIRHHEQNGDSLAHIGKKLEHHEEYAKTYPSYEYSYKISDPDTKDVKGQHETRDGDKVNGLYWLLQPNGYKRTVNYVANNGHGFKAKVRYHIQKGHKYIHSDNNQNENDNNNENENVNMKQNETQEEINQQQTTGEENLNNNEQEKGQILEENEEMRSNSKAIDSSESINSKDNNNNSQEKSDSETKSQFISRHTGDLNNDGSTEERVWIPPRNTYVSTQTFGSYQVTESNENDENKADADNMNEGLNNLPNLRNRGSNEKGNTYDSQKGLGKTRNVLKLEINQNKKNKHNTNNRHSHGQHSDNFNVQTNVKSTSKDTNQAMLENQKPIINERHILKHNLNINDKNKPNSYTHEDDIEDYQSHVNNDYKSRHRYVKAEYGNKIHNTKENSDLRDLNLSGNMHQIDNENSRSREESDNKSKNRSGKLENVGKILNTKEENNNNIKITEDSPRGIAPEHGRTKLHQPNINYHNKDYERADSLPNKNNRNREENSKVNDLRQTKNNKKEKEIIQSHSLLPVNNNQKQLELIQNDDNSSEEIFEHHIVVHHPTYSHKNRKSSS